VDGCVARINSANGIVMGHGSTVRSSTVRENQSDGIYATYGVEVSGNNCSRNGSAVGGDGAGIYVEGVDNRIDGNLVLSNDRGIETAIGGNTIVRNSASGNGTDYGAITAGNDVGPIGAAASASSPWANIRF
jgi:parallel beta-helix repeat protein